MNVTDALTASASTASAGKQLDQSDVGREDFLNLMVAQMQNQDPLNPADGQQMMGQIAQMSMLSEITELNTRMEDLIKGQQAMMSSQSTALIGRDITAMTNVVQVGAEGKAKINVRYPQEAQGGSLTITDAGGNTVKNIPLNAGDAGDHEVQLNLPPGSYRVEANVDIDGAPIPAMTLMHGMVDGIDFSSGLPLLDINGTQVHLGDVVSVARQGAATDEDA